MPPPDAPEETAMEEMNQEEGKTIFIPSPLQEQVSNPDIAPPISAVLKSEVASSLKAEAASSRTCSRYVQRFGVVDHLGFFCAISVFAYAGVLARVYLSELVRWNGLPQFPSFYSEVVGSALMGLVLSNKRLLKQRHKLTYDGLATGLCGSITTFSMWNDDAASVLLQCGDTRSSDAARLIGWATVLLLGLGMPVVALTVGRHAGLLSPWADARKRQRAYAAPGAVLRVAELLAYVVLWVVITTVVTVVSVVAYGRYDMMFAFLLGSLGAYIRWHLSPLNADCRHFRPGTFLVNILGSWLLAAALTLELHYQKEGEVIRGLLYGVTTGFCGCLTTISTFAVELTTLPVIGRYFYSFLSISVAQIGIIAIRGNC